MDEYLMAIRAGYEKARDRQDQLWADYSKVCRSGNPDDLIIWNIEWKRACIRFASAEGLILRFSAELRELEERLIAA